MSIYLPRGAAKALFKCRAEEILIEGPAGTGKTRGVLTKVRLAMEKYRGARALLFRKTRESMTETVLPEWENAVLGRDHPCCQGASRRVRQVYQFDNGSTVVIAGMDKPAKVMSAQYDLVAGFEANELLENDWELAMTRLRNGVMPYQQGIADTNPDRPMHWLNKRAESGQMVRLLSKHEDNPRWYDDAAQKWTPEGERYVVGVLGKLTGVRRARLRDGRWAAAEGLVYDEWQPGVNVIDPFPIPPEWRRIRSIDFGYTNPFVCQWWAIDGDGRMYLYREIYRAQTLVSKHGENIKALSMGERIEVTVADHDAEDRATLAAGDVPTIPAVKAIEYGIQLVSDRIIPAGDGRPRIFIMRDCTVGRDELLAERKLPTSTQDEIDGYVWAKNANGLLIREQPVDQDNHGMDGMRYAVAHVDKNVATLGAWVSQTPQPKRPDPAAPKESALAMMDRLRKANPDWGFDED